MSPIANRTVERPRHAREWAETAPPRAGRAAIRTALGVTYLVALLFAAGLPFLAFGPIGLFILVPTVLWVAPGLRTRVRVSGNLSDGVVGWPALTTLGPAAASLAMMAVGGRAMAAAWLASLAACGLLELARARVAKSDSLRAESGATTPFGGAW
jgi:hypothetical protein